MRRRLLVVGPLLLAAAVLAGLVGSGPALDPAAGSPAAAPPGPLQVTEAGTVVEDREVEGSLTIEADDVVVRRTRVRHSGIHGVRIASGVTGTRLEDVEVVCTNPRGNGVVFGGYTAVRVTVTGCRNGFVATTGGRTRVVDSTADGEPVELDTRAGTGTVPSPRGTGAEPDPLPPVPVTAAARSRGVGHRFPVRETITAEEAVRRLARHPVLERVEIRGGLRLSGDLGRGWTVRDSVLRGGSPYLVQAYTGGDEHFSGSPAERPRFEHVTLVGAGVHDPAGRGTSACFYGSDAVLTAVHAYGCVDILKPYDRVLVERSYAHDLHRPAGAHADVVQIREGVDTVLRDNELDARIGYGEGVGSEGNAVLQTGSLTGPVRRVHLLDNRVTGGLYTLRLGGEDEAFPVDYLLRGNVHGRRSTYGPVTGATDAPASSGGVRYDDSNVWTGTGRPVVGSVGDR